MSFPLVSGTFAAAPKLYAVAIDSSLSLVGLDANAFNADAFNADRATGMDEGGGGRRPRWPRERCCCYGV